MNNNFIITQNGVDYFIPSSFQDDELIKLILNSESLDIEEKQFWFYILPNMTNEQIVRLFKILENEKIQLEELEKRYSKEIEKLKTLNINFF